MRYEFASKILLSNTSKSNLGFLIGATLCLLGSLFIIRKSKVDIIEANGSNKQLLNFSIKTTSPGIFIVFMGTLLLFISIISKNKYNIKDNDQWVNSQSQTNHKDGGLTGNENYWNEN